MGLLGATSSRKLKFLYELQKDDFNKDEWKDVLATKDIEFIKLCYKIQPKILKEFSSEFKKNKEVVSYVFNEGGIFAGFEYVDENLKQDQAFISEVVTDAVKKDKYKAANIYFTALRGYISGFEKVLRNEQFCKTLAEIEDKRKKDNKQTTLNDLVDEHMKSFNMKKGSDLRIFQQNQQTIEWFETYCDINLLKELLENSQFNLELLMEDMQQTYEISKVKNKTLAFFLKEEAKNINRILKGTPLTSGDTV